MSNKNIYKNGKMFFKNLASKNGTPIFALPKRKRANALKKLKGRFRSSVGRAIHF